MRYFVSKEFILTFFLFMCISFLHIDFIVISRDMQYLAVFTATMFFYSIRYVKNLNLNFNYSPHYFLAIILCVLGLQLFFESLRMILQLTLFKNEDLFYVTYKNLGLEFIIAILVYPFLEELFFRRIILEKLFELMGSRKAIIISSIIFTAFHFYSGDTNYMYVFTISVFLGYIYKKTNSLALVFLAHSFANLVGLSYNVGLKTLDSRYDLFRVNLWWLFLVFGLFLFFLSYKILKGNDSNQ